MRYHGQGHEIEIVLPDRALTKGDTSILQQAFETAYSAQFSRPVPGMSIEILNWSVLVSTTEPPARQQPISTKRQVVQISETRRIQCDLTGQPIDAAVILRGDLRPGDQINGPALVVEPQTTTLVSTGFQLSVDGFLNLVLERNGGQA